jgi:sulfur-oxidizing protein SoxZ
VCTFNGAPVLTADLEPAIAANPYFEFTVKVTESGTFAFAWKDDDGTVTTAEQGITVT